MTFACLSQCMSSFVMILTSASLPLGTPLDALSALQEGLLHAF